MSGTTSIGMKTPTYFVGTGRITQTFQPEDPHAIYLVDGEIAIPASHNDGLAVLAYATRHPAKRPDKLLKGLFGADYDILFSSSKPKTAQ